MITKLNNRELFQFCEQFSIILRSGMSAIEGLAILNDDSQTERGKEILTFLYKDMEESGSLAHAMEQSGAFPASAAAYVRTGEETGCLVSMRRRFRSQTRFRVQSPIPLLCWA